MAKKGLDKKRYDRMARIYDLVESPMELMAFSKWRRFVMDMIDGGTILEIGIGSGKNVPYYRDWNVIGVDISRKMLEKAKSKILRLDRDVELVQADAESLPFKDDVFDAVISTFVFCSVENPVEGLKELYRVLKPKGKAIFLEHMRCENEIGGKILDALNPIFRVFGPEVNRRTNENIKKAGFRIVKEIWLLTSVFRLIVAEKG